jgi:hypothetical protein
MAKGSGGLSIDSDPIATSGYFLHKSTVLTSFPEENINPKWKHLAATSARQSMDVKANRSPPSTFQFPVKLINTNEHDHDHDPDSSLPSDNRRRTVIDEMDFFADKKHDVDRMTIINNGTGDLKDSGIPAGLELNVNVRDLYQSLCLKCSFSPLTVFLLGYTDWFESSYYQY